MSKRIAVVLSALGLFAAAAGADAVKLKPGKYEITMALDINGQKVPPTTQQRCLEAKDAASPKDFIAKMQRDQTCQLQNVVDAGNKISFDMVCKKDNGKGHGEMTFTAEQMTMDMTMSMAGPQGKTMNMSQHLTSRRVGDCP